MILISGDLEIDPAFDEQFLQAVTTLVAATRAEAGCERYEFFRSLETAGGFHVSEEWASEEALAAHLTTDHYKTFGRAMRGFGPKRVDVFRFDAEGKRRLG